jgi:putative DNA primase/helicase
VPPAVSGERGHDQTFRAACALVLGFDLPVEDAYPLLEEWNERCQPPWTEKELLHKLEDADKKDDQRGYLLGSSSTADSDDASEAVDDPDRLARGFLASRYTGPSGITLRFWRQEWHRWRKGAYQPYPDEELQAEVWTYAWDEFATEARRRRSSGQPGRPPQAHKVSVQLCHNVAAALRSRCIVSGDTEQPAWLSGMASFPADEVIAAQNGLLHLPAGPAGQPSLHSPTPDFFTGIALDYDIDLAAQPPQGWLNFLDQLWPGDTESVEALREWFGYCLLPDTRLQKILFMVGPQRSGKGTITRVLRQLLGRDNVVGPSLSDLAGPFGLQELLGKSLAVIPDARLSGRSDQAVIVERLLSVSGEDALSVNRKNLTAVTTRLSTSNCEIL